MSMEGSCYRKGFIHIVEIIIISLVMFILVVQFSSIPTIKSDWDRTKLILRGNDLIHSLDASGINWLDAEEVDQRLSDILGGSVKYDVTVRNAIKPEMQVGCICTDQETSDLEDILESFTLNNQEISFMVHQIDPEEITFPAFYDVILMGEWAGTHKEGAWDSYYGEMETYLAQGGGLLEIRDPGKDDFEEESTLVYSNLFGMFWNSSLEDPGSEDIYFTIDQDSPYYNIRKYFYHIPSDVNFTTWSEFETFDLTPGKISPSDQQNHRVILIQGGTDIPNLIINSQISNTRGRTAWLAEGDDSSAERSNLIRSLVAWLSGEEHRVVPGDISQPNTFTKYKVLGPDMVQPVEIALSLGYVF